MSGIPGLKERLEGRRVTSFTGGSLTLDDGSVVTLYPSYEGCSCVETEGTWVEGDSVDAIITDVSIEVTNDNTERYVDYDADPVGHYSAAVIKVLHDNHVIAQGSCRATDGNDGHYVSVMSLKVVSVERGEFQIPVMYAGDPVDPSEYMDAS